jgi:hypothetical protein
MEAICGLAFAAVVMGVIAWIAVVVARNVMAPTRPRGVFEWDTSTYLGVVDFRDMSMDTGVAGGGRVVWDLRRSASGEWSARIRADARARIERERRAEWDRRAAKETVSLRDEETFLEATVPEDGWTAMERPEIPELEAAYQRWLTTFRP